MDGRERRLCEWTWDGLSLKVYHEGVQFDAGQIWEVGEWEVGMLGNWEFGRLGDWDVGKLGDWDVGILGNWKIGKRGIEGMQNKGQRRCVGAEAGGSGSLAFYFKRH